MSLSDDDRSDDERALPEREALRRMHRVTADHGRPFEERLTELLTLGRTYLGVEAGFLTETSDGTQSIVEQVVGAHGWDVAVTEGSDGGARFEITGLDEDGSGSEVSIRLRTARGVEG
ncbi:hypothetical protein [Halobellus rarus]|uniref:Amphi-Trp domain-containing protein n=1 Tax=Halobellus rarus TaxID=1126237 RepID=A0ABD6CLX6_9EURY|nr:hypothetical protein [Halobellus rarus]